MGFNNSIDGEHSNHVDMNLFHVLLGPSTNTPNFVRAVRQHVCERLTHSTLVFQDSISCFSDEYMHCMMAETACCHARLCQSKYVSAPPRSQLGRWPVHEWPLVPHHDRPASAQAEHPLVARIVPFAFPPKFKFGTSKPSCRDRHSPHVCFEPRRHTRQRSRRACLVQIL